MTMTLKQFARKGGYARAAKLSKAQREEIARKAGQASGKARKEKANSHRETTQIYGENDVQVK